jgi:hypothetical protein
MHYIRFLKPPRVLPALQPLNLTTKITVTTDLGESFLLANMSLLVELEYEDGTSVLGSGKGREYMWRGEDGMRSLEIVVPFPPTNGKRKIGGQMVRMFIRPKEAEYDVNTFEMVLNDQDTNVDSGESGVVVAVRSMAVDISSSTEGGKAPSVGMAERVFAMDSNDSKRKVRIWEETGESIARHIWYAAFGSGQVRPPFHSTNMYFLGMPGWYFLHISLLLRQSLRQHAQFHNYRSLRKFYKGKISMCLSLEPVVESSA